MKPLVAVLAVAVLAGPALAAPGDPRIIQGTVEWPPALGAEPFIVVRGDNGQVYAVDVQNAERRGSGPLGAGDRISIVGVEATRPHEVAALVVGVGDAAVATFPMPPTPPPGQATVAAPATTPRSARPLDPLWRLQGRVEALPGTNVVVRTPDGAAHTVDLSQLSDLTRRSLRAGETITLFGVPRDDRRLVANGYIQLEDTPPAASPRTE
jgi:hypothetical protein